MIRQRNGRIILFFLLLFLIGIILLVFLLLCVKFTVSFLGVWGNWEYMGKFWKFVYLFAGLNLRILAFFISCDVILYFYYILGFMNLENICITN